MPETSRDPRSLEPQPPLPWASPGILVGVDGSAGSIAALRRAAKLAPALGLPLHAVVVWDYPTLVSGDYYYPEEYIDSADGVVEIVATAAEQVFDGDPPEWFTSSLRRGKPARELVELSKEAAMLVVGGRGHGGFLGLLLGSVSDACAAHAHCPVLVVHDR
jgi:nucleotide-binding universal stress UspA family protein